MAQFLKCTKEHGEIIFVNVELIRVVEPFQSDAGKNLTRVRFDGGHFVSVQETPEQICGKGNVTASIASAAR
jgi:hypothetical protein